MERSCSAANTALYSKHPFFSVILKLPSVEEEKRIPVFFVFLLRCNPTLFWVLEGSLCPHRGVTFKVLVWFGEKDKDKDAKDKDKGKGDKDKGWRKDLISNKSCEQ